MTLNISRPVNQIVKHTVKENKNALKLFNNATEIVKSCHAVVVQRDQNIITLFVYYLA